MKTKSQKVLIIPILTLIIGFAVFTFIKSNKPATTEENNQNEESQQIEQPFAFENKPVTAEFKNQISNEAISKNFSLYEVDPHEDYFPSSNLAKEVSKILELKQLDENTWQDETYTVSYLPNDFYIKIKIKGESKNGKDLNETEIKNKTEELIKRLNIWPFYTKNVEEEIQIFEMANVEGTIATITFREKLDNLQIYTSILKNAEIYAEINESGEVTEIRYFYVPYKKKDSELQIKTVEEIQVSLEQGKYKKPDDTIDFTKIYIEQVENIYYTSTASRYIQPMFLIKGKNEFNESLELFVSALKSY